MSPPEPLYPLAVHAHFWGAAAPFPITPSPEPQLPPMTEHFLLFHIRELDWRMLWPWGPSGFLVLSLCSLPLTPSLPALGLSTSPVLLWPGLSVSKGLLKPAWPDSSPCQCWCSRRLCPGQRAQHREAGLPSDPPSASSVSIQGGPGSMCGIKE